MFHGFGVQRYFRHHISTHVNLSSIQTITQVPIGIGSSTELNNWPTDHGWLGELPSLKLTFSHLKMDGWKTFLFPFGAFRPVFRCVLLLVSGWIIETSFIPEFMWIAPSFQEFGLVAIFWDKLEWCTISQGKSFSDGPSMWGTANIYLPPLKMAYSIISFFFK